MAPSPESSDGNSPFAAIQPEAVRAVCGRTLEQLRTLSDAWISTVHKSVESGWDLAAQLAKCADPSEAVLLCKQWMTDRQDALMSDGTALSELWLKTCQVDPTILGKFAVPFPVARVAKVAAVRS
jgi:hypothetical protein